MRRFGEPESKARQPDSSLIPYLSPHRRHNRVNKKGLEAVQEHQAETSSFHSSIAAVLSLSLSPSFTAGSLGRTSEQQITAGNLTWQLLPFSVPLL